MIKIKKKTVLIVTLVTIVIVLLLIILFLFRRNNESKYPQEPVEFTSLSQSSLDLDISGLRNIKSKDLLLYSTITSDGETTVREIMDKMGISFLDKDITGIDPKEWDNGKDIFRYYGITDTLVFQLRNGIKFEETENELESFFEEYLNVKYSFDIVDEKTTNSGGLRIYGRRLIGEIALEVGYGDEYSDYLEFNNSGYLIGGQILLTDFNSEGVSLPTVSEKYLKEMVNSDVYPKETYLNTSILTQSIDLNYLDDAWGEIEDSANNCEGSEQEVVFIYKNTKQKYLIPIYKISGDCEVEYKDVIYNVPSTFYVLAADPKYIVKE